MINAGDSPAGRLKANITRQVTAGVKVPKMATAKIPHDGDATMDKMTKPKLRPAKKGLKFLGSFKFGGPVHHTGVYLLHKGEHVNSPLNRRKK